MTAEAKRALEALPRSTACRRIDFTNAKVVPGIVPKTYFLIVSGTKPWLTMDVSLTPLIYVRQPDYWGIEVIGCLNGIGLPALAPYTVQLDITHVLGKKGVEVIGAKRSKKIKVP
jgi:hypothetical protein